MVEMINYGRTWIIAELNPVRRPYLMLIDGNIALCYSPSLDLRVVVPQNGYKRKQKWTVPEIILEKTARKIKAEDGKFWLRLTSGKMTYEDIERLILGATYGLVDLNLEE